MTLSLNALSDPMSAAIEQAQQALNTGRARVVDDYRPGYHLAPPAGWMNDPNGVVYFRGEYHVFYQHYPFDAKWGPMYWGHAKSADLVHWQHLPIALAPGDEVDRDGCFSGSAVVHGDTLALIYTGHAWLGEVGDERFIRQVQCLATSVDGIHFVKHGAVIEAAPHASIMHFRDPKVWRQDEHWYLIAGARLEDQPLLPLYRSADLHTWEFLDYVASGSDGDGYMWECPDLFRLDGRDVLLYSPQGMPAQGYAQLNKYHTGYRVGRLDSQWQFTGGLLLSWITATTSMQRRPWRRPMAGAWCGPGSTCGKARRPAPPTTGAGCSACRANLNCTPIGCGYFPPANSSRCARHH